MFRLWQQIEGNCKSEFIFDFSECSFLRQNAVAFLGGLVRLIEARGGCAIIACETLQNSIKTNLTQNGFLYTFNKDREGWPGNSIPYREDTSGNLDNIGDYLENLWLGRDWVEVDSAIKDEIVCNVLEVYTNAFEHGQSDIGVFTCGQRYPNLNILKLTVIDFGVGIPANVRQFHQNDSLPAEDALRWAFKPGTTTRRSIAPGGTGLNLLKKFVTSKRGKIEFYSHNGYALIDQQQETYYSVDTFFKGTLMNITIRCDVT